MGQRVEKVAVLAAAVALALAGCGGGSGDGSSPERAERRADAKRDGGGREKQRAGALSGAATLRGTLTGLLVDHGFLAGFAMNTGLAQGFDSTGYRSAAGALDANARQLGRQVRAIFGRPAEARFLDAWRAQNEAYQQAAAARASSDDEGLERARRTLSDTRTALSEVINDVSPRLPPEQIAERLQSHQDAVLEVVDAAARRSTSTYALLRRAGASTTDLASALADGFARQFPERFTGSATAGAGELRARLTALLVSHEHLLGATIGAGAGAGLQSKAFTAASRALEGGTEALAEAFGGVFGDEAEQRFAGLWGDHIDAFVRYTSAQAGRDRAGAAAALGDLEAFRRELGGFIGGESRELPAAGVADALRPYVEATTAVARAAVKGSPKTFERLRAASGELPKLAAVLADGIARQYPEQFPAS